MTKAKFYLYRNLHKGGFSVKHKGLVCARGDALMMENVEFRVSKKGNERARTRKRRNVHAFMISEDYIDVSDKNEKELEKMVNDMIEVTYNPFKCNSFIIKKTGKRIDNASIGIAFKGKVYVK